MRSQIKPNNEKIEFDKLDLKTQNKIYDEFMNWIDSLPEEPSLVNCWVTGFLHGIEYGKKKEMP